MSIQSEVPKLFIGRFLATDKARIKHGFARSVRQSSRSSSVLCCVEECDGIATKDTKDTKKEWESFFVNFVLFVAKQSRAAEPELIRASSVFHPWLKTFR